MTNIGRNSPCPCASGKQYERCCAERSQPGFDLQRIVGISLNPKEKRFVYVTNDILLNQLRRESLEIAESFDRLHEADLREMSQLLGSVIFLLWTGFRQVNLKGDELRAVGARLIFNAANTFVGAATLLRNGLYLQASMLVRSILESIAAVIHLVTTPSDLQRFKEGKIKTSAILAGAKKVFPVIGRIHGMFSESFLHLSSFHVTLQPVQLYDGQSEEVNANLSFLRASVWLLYVAVELLFLDMLEVRKYWRPIGNGQVAYEPSEETLKWEEKFLGSRGYPSADAER